MLCVTSSLVSNSKVVDHEGEFYYIIVVAPQYWRDWCRLISEWADMFLEHRVLDDALMDYPIHPLLCHNIYKAIHFLIHEVVLINDVLRYQAECNLVVIILRHWVVEVEFIDINHWVLGARGRYDGVSMNFGICEVRCWGGDWSIRDKFISSHCEFHSVNLFLLGQNVADDMAICDLVALG